MKPHTYTNRSLCECEFYAPANYDNDQEMKEVMQQFEDRTSQRFHEYDERMQSKRMQYKDRCDKEIQKIILKDKLEKQMVEQFSTLQTDIQNDAIPTCVCEKSVADKVEKTCLKCAGVLGGGVTPAWGLISGIVYTGWKAAALATAKELAEKAGAAEGASQGAAAGAAKVIELIKLKFPIEELSIGSLDSIIDANTYTKSSLISGFIQDEFSRLECGSLNMLIGKNKPIFCTSVYEGMAATRLGNGVDPTEFIETTAQNIASEAEGVAARVTKTATDEATVTLTAQKTGVVQSTYMSYQTPIIASIVAILVIVLVMIIIYLILRYRRKKKMKKKLQYIKLLEE